MTATARKQVDLVRDLIQPIPRQVDFLQASLAYRFLLYGGSRGPGKSRTLRWGLLWRLITWFLEAGLRNVRVGLFCEDYPTLADRQISKIATEFPSWLGRLKTTKQDGLGFYLHDAYGGGILTLRNLDDPQKYVGGEWAGIAVDELTRNARKTFDDLRSCLRWPGIRDTFFWGGTNPLGVGLHWVRGLWIERDAAAAGYEGGALGTMQGLINREFHFVPALPSDNPHLTAEYWDDLRSQPDHIQKAWIAGDWYALIGAVFSEWRAQHHILPRGFQIPPSWRYSAGMDWGYRNPGCFILFAGGPEDAIGCDEYYFKEQTGYQVGLAIGHRCQSFPHVEYIAGDTDMWAMTGQGAVTIAEEVQRGLVAAFGGRMDLAPKLVQIVKQGEKGQGFRKSKLNRLHEWLAWGPPRPSEDAPEAALVQWRQAIDATVLPPWQRPRMRFLEGRCPEAVRTIPALPYAKPTASNQEPEDVDTTAEDHPYDAVTGWAMSRPPLAEREPVPRSQDQHPGFDRRGHRKREPATALHGAPDYDHPQFRVPRHLEEAE